MFYITKFLSAEALVFLQQMTATHNTELLV